MVHHVFGVFLGSLAGTLFPYFCPHIISLLVPLSAASVTLYEDSLGSNLFHGFYAKSTCGYLVIMSTLRFPGYLQRGSLICVEALSSRSQHLGPLVLRLQILSQ